MCRFFCCVLLLSVLCYYWCCWCCCCCWCLSVPYGHRVPCPYNNLLCLYSFSSTLNWCTLWFVVVLHIFLFLFFLYLFCERQLCVAKLVRPCVICFVAALFACTRPYTHIQSKKSFVVYFFCIWGSKQQTTNKKRQRTRNSLWSSCILVHNTQPFFFCVIT